MFPVFSIARAVLEGPVLDGPGGFDGIMSIFVLWGRNRCLLECLTQKLSVSAYLRD
jgi:hypothetical protein